MTDEAEPAVAAVHFDNVLVPLDGSELSLQALPTARVLAKRFNAELHTLTVDDGDPAEGIASRAESLGACVVCMATHGRGRLGGAVIGSVARSVLHSSTNPVIALGPSADNPGWSPRPRSWPEPLSVSRIVACVDGSTTSEQILPIAASWAEALDMSLTILTVVGDGPDHADAEAYIEGLLQQWSAQLPDADGEVVRDPLGAASGMRAHLDRRPAGLVALTTHARSGLQRVLLGAAAAGIVHASVAPCLVAPVRS